MINLGFKRGFSLIELMIVIAIIGILSTLAIPSYQDYLIKSRAAELLIVAGPAKAAVSEAVLIRGESAGFNASTVVGNVTTTYVTSVVGSNNGVITILGNAAALGLPATTVIGIVLTPTYSSASTNVSWACTPSTGTLTATKKYLPAGCRS